METLQLKFSLKIADSEERARALRDLKRRLEDAGVTVELLTEPPVEGELAGGKVAALLLTISLLEPVNSVLEQVHQWHEQHQGEFPVLHLTGQQASDEKILDEIEHKQYHIEVERPEIPVKPQESVGASPKPPAQKE